MTTPAAAAMYEAQFVAAHSHLGFRVYNPENKPFDDLPVIFGFNNGGSTGWLEAVAIAEDGVALGNHICSSEFYMPSDLGLLDETRPDREQAYKEHYPHGFRCEFVSYDDVHNTPKLVEAFRLNKLLPRDEPEGTEA